MRKKRWEVEQFRYTDENCEETVPYSTYFRRKADALAYWQREKKAYRLFLASGLYLRLPGGRRKLIMLYYSDKEMLAALERFLDDLNSGKFFEETEAAPLTV